MTDEATTLNYISRVLPEMIGWLAIARAPTRWCTYADLRRIIRICGWYHRCGRGLEAPLGDGPSGGGFPGGLAQAG